MHTRNRIIVIAIALAIVVGIFLWRRSSFRPPHRASAIAVANPPMVAILPPGLADQANTPDHLREIIERGRAALERSHLTMAKCGGHGAHWKRCLGDYLLAASDGKGNILVIEAYEGRPSSPVGFKVTVEDRSAKRRGVNVPFEVKAPPGWTVVGLRTAVWDDRDIEGGVYAPYSKALDTEEVREAGLRYLEQIAAEALADLQRLRVKSRFYRGKLVAETVELQHMVSLVLTEQMKSDVLFERGTPAERIAMVNRTLTILGANQERAYGYVRSQKGAAGIAQLMSVSYRRLCRSYPQAGLPIDLDARLDHAQAMKAMVLHADDQWWAVSKDRVYRDWLRSHDDARRLMLAAGYNASAGTVAKAIKGCRETWRDASCTLLPSETRRYLIKYEAMWDLLYPVVHSSQKMAATP